LEAYGLVRSTQKVSNLETVASVSFQQEFGFWFQLSRLAYTQNLLPLTRFQPREIDYAMLVKKYGDSLEAEKRYSPPVCIGCDRQVVRGRPDPNHISTSYVERQNLSMRMGMRRFTRLTNAFSKKLENHMHALSIYFMHYNFVRIPKPYDVRQQWPLA